MKALLHTCLFILLLLPGFLFGQVDFDTAKPWTYWWWMGSAVDKENIRKQLDDMSEAGLGGVHIIPIYGVKGYEDHFLNFLSEDWMEAVQFTIKEAGKRNLGVDMTLGTGWPFGGPMIEKEDAAKKLLYNYFILENCERITLRLPQLMKEFNFLGLVAIYASNGKERLNLLNACNNDQIDLEVSPGNWEISLYGTGFTRQKVKRAAPGGEGWVMDYFDPNAVAGYLEHFDSVFSNTEHPISPRAFYHDSYEVYGADWTSGFADAFRTRRGYDIEDYLYILQDTSHADYPLLLHDLRATLSELLYSEFTEYWTKWSREQNRLTRNQAHGSPGNILDLYGLSHIPETESFGCSEFDIPDLDCDPDYQPERFGRPSPLLMKFASSPAHLMGKPLVSSETATWLANHFKVSLRRVKPQVDELLISGINHIFYHGTTYSPEDEAYPGWLFYASTNFGRNTHFREEFPLLNSYIEKCQSALQSSTPDNDILLYFPISELWTNYRDKENGRILLQLDVHHYADWFSASSFGKCANWLWKQGYTFDYVSDLQITRLNADKTARVFLSDMTHYKIIIVPAISNIPGTTLQHLNGLAEQGCRIIFLDQFPQRHPGLSSNPDSGLSIHPACMLSRDLKHSLDELQIRQEKMKAKGLDFIRKKNSQGHLYFITNFSSQSFADSLQLRVPYKYLTITDPLTGQSWQVKNGQAAHLRMDPGKSYLVQTSDAPTNAPERQGRLPLDTIELDLNWEVRFHEWERHGLKRIYRVDTLKSWTTWEDRDLRTYSGKASYMSTFQMDTGDEQLRSYTLEIEEIRESARVILNGVKCGTLWSFPNRLEIPATLLKDENQLEIVVQNLAANHMIKYDHAHPEWKKFYDINMVDIRYKPFSTKEWSHEPSGIIGKISLIRNKVEQMQ